MGSEAKPLQYVYIRSTVNVDKEEMNFEIYEKTGGKKMNIKVQYSTMIVKNLEESVSFYRDVLGFKEGYHVDLPNGGRITIMQSDGAAVELIESSAFPVGLYSIGTDVDDLEAAISKLAEKGYQTTGPVMETTVGKQTFVLDPNGTRICLIEHTEAYKKKYM